jgi:hypothetical protein
MSGGFFRVINHTYFLLNVLASYGFGDVLAFSLWLGLNLGSISLNFKGYKEPLFSTISLMFRKIFLVSISGHLGRSGNLFSKKHAKLLNSHNFLPELDQLVSNYFKP